MHAPHPSPPPATSQLPEIPWSGLDRHGDVSALEAFGPGEPAVWTFTQLEAAISQLARGLLAMGLRPGQRVALVAEPGPWAIIAALAVLRAGTILVPLDTQLPTAVLGQVLLDASPKLMIADRALQPRLPALPCPRTAPDELLSLATRAAQEQELPPLKSTATAAIFYTSGTTGQPKGVPLTTANLAYQVQVLAHSGLVGPRERVLMPLPLHHVYPLVVGTLAPLCLGLTLLLPAGLTGPELARALNQGRASVLVGVPRIYQALAEAVRGRIVAGRWGRLRARVFDALLGLGRATRTRLGPRLGEAVAGTLFGPLRRALGPELRLLASGGAPLDPELAGFLADLGFDLAVGYGLTESSPLLTLRLPGHQPAPGPGVDVGQAVDGTSLRVETPDAEGFGELLASGPGVFGGYRYLPAQTAKALDGGWLRTGDVARIDPQGFVRLRGRVATLIVTPGGKKLEPEEVESVLETHPFLREAGILAHGNGIGALVVPDVEALRDAWEDDMAGAVRSAVLEAVQELPGYCRPTEVRLSREPLPRTRLGKLRRAELAARFAAAGPEPVDPLDDSQLLSDDDRLLLLEPKSMAVWNLLIRRYPGKALFFDANPQLDLGIDSLEWLTLTLEIRDATGVELTDKTVDGLNTVRDLLRAVAGTSPQTKRLPRADPLGHPELVLPPESRYWLAPLSPLGNLWARPWFGLLGACLRLGFGLTVRGLENLPADGAFVIAPNHASYLDAFVVLAAMGFARSRHQFVAGWTGAAFHNRVFRHFSRLAQAIPVDGRAAAREGLAYGAAVLRAGHGLLWFPEGRRSRDGKLLPFRPGLGLLLGAYPRPVVPTIIRGTFQALPAHRSWPRPARLEVVFGPAVDPATLAAEGHGASFAARFTSGLRARMLAMQEQTQDPASTHHQGGDRP